MKAWLIVFLKPIVDTLGLSWGAQTRKLKKQNKKFNLCPVATVGKDGKKRNMLCIPVNKINGWLFSINPEKVREDLKETLEFYQEECF